MPLGAASRRRGSFENRRWSLSTASTSAYRSTLRRGSGGCGAPGYARAKPRTSGRGRVGVLCDRVGERVVRNAMAYPFGQYQGVGEQWPNRGLQEACHWEIIVTGEHPGVCGRGMVGGSECRLSRFVGPVSSLSFFAARPPDGTSPSRRVRPRPFRSKPGTPSRPWPPNRPTSPASPPGPAREGYLGVGCCGNGNAKGSGSGWRGLRINYIALGFFWTLDCERVLAGGVSR